MTHFVSPSAIRTAFSAAMSAMYRVEVPAYAALIELVRSVNDEVLRRDPEAARRLDETGSLERISEERHGAVRVGTPRELSMMRRVFAVMGMQPVGYYDLSEAGVPVHSTAFRPVDEEALRLNPFRVFTSLLRLDLMGDIELRREAAAILSRRQIFTQGATALIERSERDGGLCEADASAFVAEVLQTFRWRSRAEVSSSLYHRLHDQHRLLADIVAFSGPHINHLTPRTLDIDAVQALMPSRNISPKAVVEGPPRRACPILLRQTSFKALEEPIAFADGRGGWERGSHTARFGEVEERGVALTRKGRKLYDELLAQARRRADTTDAYHTSLAASFAEFPDRWSELRRQGLAHFAWSATAAGRWASTGETRDIDTLVERGWIRFDPIIYEDFLPVSAAGIFRSNLGDNEPERVFANPNKAQFEADLGAPVADEFELYGSIEQHSMMAALEDLSAATAPAAS